MSNMSFAECTINTLLVFVLTYLGEAATLPSTVESSQTVLVGMMLDQTTGGAPSASPDDCPKNVDGASHPVLIRKTEPAYTYEAQSKHIEGTVTLGLCINAAGKAEKIQVLKSLGYGLDQEAIKALSLWRFKPAMKDGKPIKMPATIDMSFKLTDSPDGKKHK